MRLEWFRKHKTLVYYVLLPMVFISFVLFGASGFLKTRSGTSFFGGDVGPAVTYTVGPKEVYLSPAAVLQRRIEQWRYNNGNGQPSTDEIAYSAAAQEVARQQGFHVGVEEQRERLKQAIQQKIEALDRGGSDVKINAENYKKLLTQLELSPAQFERIVLEENTAQKFYANMASNIDQADMQQFISYCAEKETVRLRYLTFKSKDYIKDTKQPEEAAIKKFYEDATKDKDKEDGEIQHRDLLMKPMTMSVEALAFKDASKFADPKATDDDLKKFYDLWKVHHPEWKEAVPPLKEGEKPPEKAPEAKYKPLDQIKADVEKAWLADEKTKIKNQFMTQMSTLMNDLKKDEQKFKDDAANKDKTFDLAAWAKAHNMTMWVTAEQTEDVYRDGKMELNAQNIKAASNLWVYARDYNTRPGQKMKPDQLANFRRNMDNFTSFQFFDNEKPAEGGVWVRKKTFNDEKLKSLEEAKPEIVTYLKQDEAIDLAKKAADKTHDDWIKGQNLPKLEDMEEVLSDDTDKANHPMVSGFKRSPKVVGDVLDVQGGLPEDAAPGKMKDHGVWYYVGCAVERKLPDWEKFAKTTNADWPRESKRQSAVMLDQFSVRAMMVQRVKDNVHRIGDQDPLLGDVLRNARDH